jgi:hypothetical protein
MRSYRVRSPGSKPKKGQDPEKEEEEEEEGGGDKG